MIGNPIRKMGLAAAWTLSAAALLAGGFWAWVQLGVWIAGAKAGPDEALRVYAAFAVYARVILVKGLLPALLLALALWPLVDRAGGFRRRGRTGVAIGLVLASAVASAAVTAALLPLDLPRFPAVKFRGALNFVRTCAEMTAAVALAALIPRLVSLASRRAIAFGTGLAAALVVGAVVAVDREGAAPPDATGSLQGPTPTAPVSPPPPADPVLAAEPVPDTPEAGEAVEELPSLAVDREELERRRAAAARIRELIEKGEDALEPPSFGGVLADGDATPVYDEEGELEGVELENLRANGFYDRVGLREGDLVQTINDVPLDATTEVVRMFATSPSFRVRVRRGDGARDTLEIPRETVMQELQRADAATPAPGTTDAAPRALGVPRAGESAPPSRAGGIRVESAPTRPVLRGSGTGSIGVAPEPVK